MARKSLSFERNPLLVGPSLDARNRSGSPYREIPIGDIDVDPDQPRRSIDQESLSELSQSIKEHGLINPILVRPMAGGSYRVIAGERRLRASAMAGLETIPAMLAFEEQTPHDLLAVQLVENIQRQDLSPMERALAVGQLRDQYNWSIREIALKLGTSKGLVQRSLEILELPDDLKAALRDGASESKVLLLKDVDPAIRKAFLSRLGELTREALELEIQEGQHKTAQRKGSYRRGTEANRKLEGKDRRLVEELQRKLGTKVAIIRKPNKPEQGRLVIDFFDKDSLSAIYHQLID